MNIQTQIAQHLLQVTEGDNWTDVNIADTIKDISVEEATHRTEASPNTIASLIHHLSYWNRIIIQRINGIKPNIPESNGFDMPALKTDQDWGNLKKDHFASVHELADAILKVDEARLEQPILPDYSSVYKNLQGTVEHIHYHLGQIVILKKLVRAKAVAF